MQKRFLCRLVVSLVIRFVIEKACKRRGGDIKMFNLSKFCFFFILNKLNEVQGIIAHVVGTQTELSVVKKMSVYV